MPTDTRPPPDRPLHLGLLGGPEAARLALAQALAEALGLPCSEGPPAATGGVSLLDLSRRSVREGLRRDCPGLLLVRLPDPGTQPLDEPAAGEAVYTATAGVSAARQAGALLPRLRLALTP